MNRRAEILAAAEMHSSRSSALVAELIRAASVNPWFEEAPQISGEWRVQAVIERHLLGLGMTVDRWQPNGRELALTAEPKAAASRDFTGRENLVGTLKGGGPGRSLLILGHADTVGVGGNWTVDPFGGERRRNELTGRGAVDMKGGLGAAIAALEVLAEMDIQLAGDILLASVIDEEAGGLGTRALIARGHRADAALVPEPTLLTIAPLCRGILWGRLTLAGRAGHIEIPQPPWRDGGAVDAIALGRLALEWLQDLSERWGEDPRKHHPLMKLPCEILVGMMHGGHSPTSYAGEVEITFNAQYLPHERDEHGGGAHVRDEIERHVAACAAGDDWLDAHPPRIEWLVDADCAETPADAPFVQTVLSAAGGASRLEGIAFHTDMGVLVDAGIPTVNFGPGDPSVAHQVDEHLPEAELHAAVAAIAVTLVEWCGLAPNCG